MITITEYLSADEAFIVVINLITVELKGRKNRAAVSRSRLERFVRSIEHSLFKVLHLIPSFFAEFVFLIRNTRLSQGLAVL